MNPYLSTAFSGVLTSTFQQAVQNGLQTEGCGLDTLVDELRKAYAQNDPLLAKFLRLYEVAYDGMNNIAIWETVISEIIRELKSPGRNLSPMPKGFVFTPETQAIWRLVERKITHTPGVIRPKDDFARGGFPFVTLTFLDLGISTLEHGWVSHMVQDLVVSEALRQNGESLPVADFRRMIQNVGAKAKNPPHMPLRLWDALYDGQGGRLTEPETVIKVLRKTIGTGVQ
jgi:hypothetical protein